MLLTYGFDMLAFVSCRPAPANYNTHRLYLFLIGLEPSTLILERLLERHGKHCGPLLWYAENSTSGVRVRLWFLLGVLVPFSL
jgi:hypothetical protein